MLEIPIVSFGINESNAEPAGLDESVDAWIKVLPRLSIRLSVILVFLDKGMMEPFDPWVAFRMETDRLVQRTNVIIDTVGDLLLHLSETGHVDQHRLLVRIRVRP